MKSINPTFEDKEIKFLERLKNKNSWHDFILNLALYYYKDGKIKKEANHGRKK